uniref:Uncharacterized protein n=1 Tax=Arundo donax TaxID=35708 RepID=A0A0A9B9J8_ARUDO
MADWLLSCQVYFRFQDAGGQIEPVTESNNNQLYMFRH